MAQAVALTGTSAHTLRKWESRYTFIEAKRTETNIRYYTDEQIKKLLNVSILVEQGYRISKINIMSNDEIHDIVTELSRDSDKDIEIKALVICMIELDENKFDSLFNDSIKRIGIIRTVTELIYPFLIHIGVLWGTSKIMPAQEHFVSSLIRKKIFSEIDSLPLPKENAKKIVLFLPEGEHHEIGLLLAFYIARNKGYRVFYLGQNVPTSNIGQVISISKSDLLMTMMVTTPKQKVKKIINSILNEFEVTILIAGNVHSYDEKDREQVKLLLKPEDLIDFFDEN